MKVLRVFAAFLFAFVVLAGASCDTQTTVTTDPAAEEGVNPQEVEFVDEDAATESDQAVDEPAAQVQGDASVKIEVSDPITDAPESEDEDAPAAQETAEPQTRVVNVQATRFEFTPSSITVNQGDTVVINFTSAEVTHGLQLSEYGVNLIAPVGETVSTQFVADKAGTFTYRCSVFCGSGHATMQGTLLVQ